MATIAQNLQKIIDSKAAIKAAINSKGGTITDDTPLEDYADAVTSMAGPNPYCDPVDTPPSTRYNASLFDFLKKVTVPAGVRGDYLTSNWSLWAGTNASSQNTMKLKVFDFSAVSGSEFTKLPDYALRDAPQGFQIIGNFSNITELGSACMYDCQYFDISDLTTQGLDFSKVTKIGGQAFLRVGQSINSTWELIAPNCTNFGAVYVGTVGHCKVTKVHVNPQRIAGGSREFQGCYQLTEIIFGSNLTTLNFTSGNMGGYNSSNPSALQIVRFKSTTPPTMGSADTFNASAHPNLAHIYVPSASVTAYQTATNWQAYASIISADPDE